MPFSTEQFALQLLAQSLFYDDEFMIFSNVSLLEPEEQRERFVAYLDPEDERYVIEEAIEWEDVDADEDGEVDYHIMADGQEYGTYETPEEAAEALLALAQEHLLQPAFMILSEDGEE